MSHKCLDPSDIYDLNYEEACRRAEDCPLCIELVEFVNNKKITNKLKYDKQNISNILKEDQVDTILDNFDLYKRGRVMRSFDEVIAQTIARMKPGQEMKLISMGELLEAHYPYAFAEVIDAIKRGVNLSYIVPLFGEGQRLSDIDLLRANLTHSVDPKHINRHFKAEKVTYDNIVPRNRKDVIYLNDNGETIDRLVEISYKLQYPLNSRRRLWVRLEESEKQDFVNELDAAYSEISKH